MTAQERFEYKQEIRRLIIEQNVSILEIPEETRIEAIINAKVTSYFDPNVTFVNGVPINGDGWIEASPQEIVKQMDWPYTIMTSTHYVAESLPAPRSPVEWIHRMLTVPNPASVVYSPARIYSFGTARAYDHKVSDLSFLIALLFHSPLTNQLVKLKKEKSKRYKETIVQIMDMVTELEKGVQEKIDIGKKYQNAFFDSIATVINPFKITKEENQEMIDNMIG